MTDLMVRFNIQLRSVTEPIGTAMGRTLLAVLSGRAEQGLKNMVIFRLANPSLWVGASPRRRNRELALALACRDESSSYSVHRSGGA